MTDPIAFLSSLGEDRLSLPRGFDPGAFVLDQLGLLGSTDPELRDELFYGHANAWIQAGLITGPDLAAILARVCGEDFLFAEIGDARGPGVFRRTFSVLILASVIDRDNRAPALGPAPRAGAFAALLDYAGREANTEGFIPEGGWAHSVAHTADALGAFLAALEPGSPEAEEALAALSGLLFKRPGRYCHEEPRRLALALRESLLPGDAGRKARATEACLTLLGRLGAEPRLDRRTWGMEAYYRRINLLDFLESLFFCLPANTEARLVAGLEARIGELLGPSP